MKIMFNPSVNFGAHLVSRSSVPYRNPDTENVELQPVAFVRYDRHNSADLETLLAVENLWQKPNIATRIRHAAYNIKNGYNNNGDIYALTTQTDSFEKLDPDKILGMAAISENNPYEIFLSNIIARPDDITHNKVGTTILDKLKNMYDSIELFSNEGVEGFYIRNGFRKVEDYKSHYLWKKHSDGYI